MLDLINKYNNEVDKLGKKAFIEVRDKLIKEWTGKSLRTFKYNVSKYNKENDTNYRVAADGKYYDNKEVALAVSDAGKDNKDKEVAKTDDKVDRVVQTSIYLENDILKQLKIKAILEDVSMNDLIKKLIKNYLE